MGNCLLVVQQRQRRIYVTNYFRQANHFRSYLAATADRWIVVRITLITLFPFCLVV
jgi:hypothetical protein